LNERDIIIKKVVKQQILSRQIFFQQTFDNDNRNDQRDLNVVEILNLPNSSSKSDDLNSV
jgi:hypothetical protein